MHYLPLGTKPRADTSNRSRCHRSKEICQQLRIGTKTGKLKGELDMAMLQTVAGCVAGCVAEMGLADGSGVCWSIVHVDSVHRAVALTDPAIWNVPDDVSQEFQFPREGQLRVASRPVVRYPEPHRRTSLRQVKVVRKIELIQDGLQHIVVSPQDWRRRERRAAFLKTSARRHLLVVDGSLRFEELVYGCDCREN